MRSRLGLISFALLASCSAQAVTAPEPSQRAIDVAPDRVLAEEVRCVRDTTYRARYVERALGESGALEPTVEIFHEVGTDSLRSFRPGDPGSDFVVLSRPDPEVWIHEEDGWRLEATEPVRPLRLPWVNDLVTGEQVVQAFEPAGGFGFRGIKADQYVVTFEEFADVFPEKVAGFGHHSTSVFEYWIDGCADVVWARVAVARESATEARYYDYEVYDVGAAIDAPDLGPEASALPPPPTLQPNPLGPFVPDRQALAGPVIAEPVGVDPYTPFYPSPDGRRAVFFNEGGMCVSSAGPDPDTECAETDPDINQTSISWSPDSRAITFVRSLDNAFSDVFRWDLTSAPPVAVTSHGPTPIQGPDMVVDQAPFFDTAGRVHFFRSLGEDGSHELMVVDGDAPSPVGVTLSKEWALVAGIHALGEDRYAATAIGFHENAALIRFGLAGDLETRRLPPGSGWRIADISAERAVLVDRQALIQMRAAPPWLVDFEDGFEAPLIVHDLRVMGAALSPDGSSVAVIGVRNPQPGAIGEIVEFATVPFAAGATIVEGASVAEALGFRDEALLFSLTCTSIAAAGSWTDAGLEVYDCLRGLRLTIPTS